MVKRGSRPIDEKIISMKMDNSQFKEKAKETERSFTNLNEKIKKTKFKGMSDSASSSVKSINKSMKGVDFTAMEKGIDRINKRFSLMEVAGRAAISGLVQNGVNKLTSVFTTGGFSPLGAMKNGLNEYYTQLGSIRVMKANTGGRYTEQQINGYLENLNDYADKTVYKFDEMTKNLGIFTAAGIKDLDTATMAIKGMMNLAATQGVDNENIMRATYQLSQALAAGKTKLLDWKSIENANLGGALFKDALIATAKELGHDPTQTKKYKEDGFRGSLETGWLTNEVMLRTLKKFSEDPEMFKAATEIDTWKKLVDNLQESYGTGWADTWKTLFGGLEESTKLFTGIKNAIEPSFDALKKWRVGLAQAFKDAGGVQNFFDMIINTGGVVKAIFERIGQAWKNVFPSAGEGIVVRIAKAFGLLAKNSASVRDFIRTSAVFDVFQKSIELALTAVKLFIKAILTGGAIVRDFLSPYISMAADGVMSFAERMYNFVQSAGSFGDVLNGLIDRVRNFNLQIKNPFEGVNVWEKIKHYYSVVTNYVLSKYEELKQRFNLPTLGRMGTFALFIAIGLTIRKGIKMVTKAISGFFDTLNHFAEDANVFKNLKKLMDNIGDCFKDFTKSFRTASLVAVAVSISVMALSLKLLASIDAEGLNRSIAALTIMMATLMIFLKQVGKIGNAVEKTGKNGKMFSSDGKTAFLRMSAFLIGLSVSLLAMTAVVGILGKMKPDTLQRGVAALVLLMGMMTILAKAVSKLNSTKKSDGKKIDVKLAGSFASLGIMVLAIAHALKTLSKIEDPEMLMTSIMAVTTILVAITGMAVVLKKADVNDRQVKPIRKLIRSITIMMLGLSLLSTIPTDKVMGATLAVGALLGAMAGTLLLLSNISAENSNHVKNASAIAIVAGSLVLMTIALLPLSFVPMEKLAASVLSLSVLMAAMANTLSIMSGTEGSIKNAASLFIMAAGLVVLAGTLTILGALPLTLIAKGLLVFASALAILTAAAYALKPVSTTVLLISRAFTSFGLACLGIGVGVWLVINAFKSLGSITGDEMDKIVANLDKLVNAFIQLAPKLALLVGEIIILIVGVLKSKTAFIALTIITMFAEIVSVVMDNINHLVNVVVTGLVIFVRVLARTIRTKGPEILYAVKSLVLSIIELFVQALFEILKIITSFFWDTGNFFDGLSTTVILGLRKSFGIKDVVTEKMEEANMASSIKSSAKALGDSIGNGAMNGVKENVKSSEFDDTVKVIGDKINNSGEIEKAGDKFGTTLAKSVSTAFKREFDLGWLLFGSEKNKKIHTEQDKLDKDKEKYKDEWDRLSPKQKEYFEKKPYLNNTNKSDRNLSEKLGGYNKPETAGMKQYNDFEAYALSQKVKSAETTDRFFGNWNKGWNTGYKAFDDILNKDLNKFGNDWTNGINKGGTRGVEAMNQNTSSLLKVAQATYNPLVNSGSRGGTGFASGLGGKAGEANSAGRNLGNRGISGVEGTATYNRGYTSGAFFGQGFLDGINAKAKQTQSAAYEMGAGAAAALRRGQQEGSPSKLTTRSGIFFAQGYINGIKKMGSRLWETVKDVSSLAVNTLTETIADIQNGFNNPIDLKPTVIPTVDWSGSELSLSRTGVGMINAADYIRTGGAGSVYNEYNTFNNKGIFDGATFIIREDADIDKIAVALDKRQQLNRQKRGKFKW
jgi:putative peptidoglycan binding domain protein|nr:MAG TPA: tail tape measure [Caudoviricetes sp.]